MERRSVDISSPTSCRVLSVFLLGRNISPTLDAISGYTSLLTNQILELQLDLDSTDAVDVLLPLVMFSDSSVEGHMLSSPLYDNDDVRSILGTLRYCLRGSAMFHGSGDVTSLIAGSISPLIGDLIYSACCGSGSDVCLQYFSEHPDDLDAILQKDADAGIGLVKFLLDVKCIPSLSSEYERTFEVISIIEQSPIFQSMHSDVHTELYLPPFSKRCSVVGLGFDIIAYNYVFGRFRDVYAPGIECVSEIRTMVVSNLQLLIRLQYSVRGQCATKFQNLWRASNDTLFRTSSAMQMLLVSFSAVPTIQELSSGQDLSHCEPQWLMRYLGFDDVLSTLVRIVRGEVVNCYRSNAGLFERMLPRIICDRIRTYLRGGTLPPFHNGILLSAVGISIPVSIGGTYTFSHYRRYRDDDSVAYRKVQRVDWGILYMPLHYKFRAPLSTNEIFILRDGLWMMMYALGYIESPVVEITRKDGVDYVHSVGDSKWNDSAQLAMYGFQL